MTRASPTTVLIVEDELFVRMIGADALEEAGYSVIEAASADEALAVLEEADNVEVLFTDIRMPGSMDGLKLAEVVHERWPGIRILLTSGDTRPSRADIPDDGRFLAKPYRFESLSRELTTLLDSR
ncbi:CheY-like chemotaxis protein [Sphingomonas endophytica]|uniref:CheY-like chemotaxis protein n=1 Tax=Sphingomonas endophytica TaxID=869719 RepID=A0A7X0J922_9SPHN|nr:response regulator [Sphingomonas endophytica]MBB5724728.1 CheY-like chemotaxis protein [Sphingomonas endophytica]MBB6503354.1 CheY-like chemotaxis protein [Sphingomonas endophytica]